MAIHRLPVELLSEVFAICGKQSVLSPVIIASVCRHWRDAVLSTPEAWANVFPHYPCLPPAYISTFIKRSEPTLLHVKLRWPESLSNDDGHVCDYTKVEILLENAHRLRCLSVDDHWIERISTFVFPNLTHLTITNAYTNILGSRLDMSIFPQLIYVDASNSSHCLLAIQPEIPPSLQFLGIGMYENYNRFQLIASVSLTLHTLVLVGDFHGEKDQNWAIHCPYLQYFRIHDLTLTRVNDRPTLRIAAPILRIYYHSSFSNTLQILHTAGTHSVTHIRTGASFRLDEYSALRILQISSFSLLENALEQLDQNLFICVKLEVIQARVYRGQILRPERLHQSLAKRNEKAGSRIKLEIVATLFPDIPPNKWECGTDMACKIIHK